MDQDLRCIGGKLQQCLPAEAAGRAAIGGHHGDLSNSRSSLSDHPSDRGALSAKGNAVRHVLDIRGSMDPALFIANRRAHRVPAVRRVGPLTDLHGSFDEVGHSRMLGAQGEL